MTNHDTESPAYQLTDEIVAAGLLQYGDLFTPDNDPRNVIEVEGVRIFTHDARVFHVVNGATTHTDFKLSDPVRLAKALPPEACGALHWETPNAKPSHHCDLPAGHDGAHEQADPRFLFGEWVAR